MKPNARVSMVNKATFNEKLHKVNADRDTRTVWECIDRPIRHLVFEMSRIGFITKFACCGYTYMDEEEPKSHHAGHAYVLFYVPDEYYETFMKFGRLVDKVHAWKLLYYQSGIWDIRAKNCVPDNMYQKNDGIEEAIHQNESYAISIDTLALNIQEHFKTNVDPVTIYDGNMFYSGIPNWIVKPKQNFVISVDDFYNTYGKYDIEEYQKTTEQRLGKSLLTPEKIEQMQKKVEA